MFTLVKPLAAYFREIPDPRCAREHKHSHVEILLLIVLEFLAGKSSLRRIVKWAKRNREKSKKSLTFTDWIGNILSTKGIHTVIDGKALRAAAEKIKDAAVSIPAVRCMHREAAASRSPARFLPECDQ